MIVNLWNVSHSAIWTAIQNTMDKDMVQMCRMQAIRVMSRTWPADEGMGSSDVSIGMAGFFRDYLASRSTSFLAYLVCEAEY